MILRARTVLAVFRAAFRNPVLRRVGFAYALFSTAEYGIWISLLVFAYRHGGPTAGMVMVLVQLVPCIALGPFLGALADRRRPSRVLFVGYGLQAVSMAGVARVSVPARPRRRVRFGAAHGDQLHAHKAASSRPSAGDSPHSRRPDRGQCDGRLDRWSRRLGWPWCCRHLACLAWARAGDRRDGSNERGRDVPRDRCKGTGGRRRVQ